MTVEVLVEYDSQNIRVRFNGIMHLQIEREPLLGIQSWMTGSRHFSIQYYFRDGTKLLTEYDDVHKWQSILRALEGLAKINPMPESIALQSKTPVVSIGRQARPLAGHGDWFQVDDQHNNPDSFEYRAIYARSGETVRSDMRPTNTKPCTCPYDERPFVCPHKYALSECWAATDGVSRDG